MIKKKTEIKEKKLSYYLGLGRRKEAVARVKLTLDKENTMIVNGLPIEKYFSGEVAKKIYLEPFRTTNTLNRFAVNIKVYGSGKNGQLGAVVHGISRALLAVDAPKYRLLLKSKGFLTRDPRTRERRKVGTGGKARRSKQSPKR
ncbi:30S ribosomal protein S9 [Candidatus Gottesmanbacteria bacterium]|nr:30S ribosomal protein S9 [Candidatus Gottesmanbacteria bacterium]